MSDDSRSVSLPKARACPSACKKIPARCVAEKGVDLNYSALRKGRRLSETQDVLKLRWLLGQMAPIATGFYDGRSSPANFARCSYAVQCAHTPYVHRGDCHMTLSWARATDYRMSRHVPLNSVTHAPLHTTRPGH
jgi:hypothetical protein